MSTPAFSVARTARTAIEADMLIALLRTSGLHPLELQTASHISLGGADVSFHIEVPTEELAEARDIMNSGTVVPGT